MTRASTTKGLVFALLAAGAFGGSGAIMKPLLEAGWSPAAAVTVRAFAAGLILLPVALLSMRGRWDAFWRGRWRILGMALIGVAGTQLAYYASVQRIQVSTAVLIEYMAPVLLVLVAWVRLRKIPKWVVLVGSVVAIAGLVLVVSPSGAGGFDALGITFALLAMIGCAIYYVVAARPSQGLPPVALAGFGLLLGGALLGLVSLTGVVPFTMTFDTVQLLGGRIPWWMPLLWVVVVATAFAYASSITASEILGSRLASFVGLLEVVAATIYAWLLLGEALSLTQLLGGVLILVGIGFVRSEKKDADPPLEPGSVVPELAVPEAHK